MVKPASFRQSGHACDHVGALAGRQAIERQRSHVRATDPLGSEFWPEGELRLRIASRAVAGLTIKKRCTVYLVTNSRRRLGIATMTVRVSALLPVSAIREVRKVCG